MIIYLHDACWTYRSQRRVFHFWSFHLIGLIASHIKIVARITNIILLSCHRIMPYRQRGSCLNETVIRSQNLLNPVIFLVFHVQSNGIWIPPVCWDGLEAAFYFSFDSTYGLIFNEGSMKMNPVPLIPGKVNSDCRLIAEIICTKGVNIKILAACKKSRFRPCVWSVPNMALLPQKIYNWNKSWCHIVTFYFILWFTQTNSALTLNRHRRQWVDLGIHTEACMTRPETCGAAGGAISLWLKIINCPNSDGVITSRRSWRRGFLIYCQSTNIV